MFDIMNSFLPFQESLGDMMEKLHAKGGILKNDLSFKKENKPRSLRGCDEGGIFH
jgi:hypothetical protein